MPAVADRLQRLAQRARPLSLGARPSAPMRGPADPRALAREHADLVAATALALAGALAALLVPAGNSARLVLGSAAVLWAPGYLLLEAAVPAPLGDWRGRGLRAALALGVGPAIAGLAALATALTPGGFRPANIVASVTLASLAFAAVAAWRRQRAMAPGAQDPGAWWVPLQRALRRRA